MKTSSPCPSMFRTTVFLACLTSGAGVGSAQQAPQYAQPPQYGRSYYAQPPEPSVKDRIQSTSLNIGNFIRRKFYGESSPTSYAQQPVYQRPPGSQPTSSQRQGYNLDAPASSAGSASGTGFQRPAPGSLPKYVTPPSTTPAPATSSNRSVAPAPATKSSSKAVVPAPKTISSPPPRPKAAPTTTAQKRYTPAKPSTFSKPIPAPAPVRKQVEDQPPAAPSSSSTTVYPEPTTEARLNREFYPLPGSPEPRPETPGISPTIGGADVDLTPQNTTPEPTVNRSTSPTSTGTTSEPGSKSSGSFLIGKKTSKEGRVVSPYAPFNELDITGLPSGSLALDPTTQKVFQVP